MSKLSPDDRAIALLRKLDASDFDLEPRRLLGAFLVLLGLVGMFAVEWAQSGAQRLQTSFVSICCLMVFAAGVERWFGRPIVAASRPLSVRVSFGTIGVICCAAAWWFFSNSRDISSAFPMAAFLMLYLALAPYRPYQAYKMRNEIANSEKLSGFGCNPVFLLFLCWEATRVNLDDYRVFGDQLLVIPAPAWWLGLEKLGVPSFVVSLLTTCAAYLLFMKLLLRAPTASLVRCVAFASFALVSLWAAWEWRDGVPDPEVTWRYLLLALLPPLTFFGLSLTRAFRYSVRMGFLRGLFGVLAFAWLLRTGFPAWSTLTLS